jgi:hypothetical protein
MKWIDLELMGEGWIPPHKVKHPDLGEVWIGGSPRKHLERTPPARYIETEALRNANFVMYAASQFPRVELGEAKVTPATDNLFWVEIEVRNDRVYPTSSDRAVALKRAVMDVISVRGGGGLEIVDLPKGPTTVDALHLAAAAEVVAAKGTEFRLKGRETKKFCALVKMGGAAGAVEFTVRSKHGGTASKTIALKAE